MRLGFILPLAVFAVVAVALAVGLTLKPREIPSALIGAEVPAFDLPPVQGRSAGLSSDDLKQGETSVVNVFASWCGPCRQEHPLLVELGRTTSSPIMGLNYKDKPANAAGWLDEFGDPYARTGADVDGRVGIDWGVYGVPETFVVDGDGRIVFKHIGVLTPEIIESEIRPRLAPRAVADR